MITLILSEVHLSLFSGEEVFTNTLSSCIKNVKAQPLIYNNYNNMYNNIFQTNYASFFRCRYSWIFGVMGSNSWKIKPYSVRPNKKISVFWVTGLKILGRLATVFFN